ncbi:putative F-box protein At1g67623 [Malania oleifera]|uniref:putative F-box protein At1g67623 n=1 Tax=Malania oleifera TaxID=397392 RepID=UPI0025AE84BE|nr:putative F-box protein At1g67623 [Malania oleifera]
MKRKRRKPPATAIKFLPQELLTEVLARVASNSLTDLCNAKLCCKEFLRAAEDDYIFKHASMEKFPVAPWPVSCEASSFLRRCKESGNAEALYREGMVEYFSSSRVDSGLQYLKEAAEKGHVEALYVSEIISACTGGQSNQWSPELLQSKKKTSECRRRVQAVLCSLWIRNYIVPPQGQRADHSKTCTKNGNTWQYCGRQMMRGTGWEDEEEDHCEACMWDHEIHFFCDIVRRGIN